LDVAQWETPIDRAGMRPAEREVSIVDADVPAA
jgi:hypothetical protein